MYRRGDPDTSFLWWRYTGGATSGTFRLEADRTGTYEFRYFTRDSYNRVATSNTLTVSVPTGLSLKASPAQVGPGWNVTLEFTAPPGRPAQDWIGLFKVGAAPTDELWSEYTGGATSGTFNIPAPAEDGIYEFRYFANNGLVELARSNSFTVTSIPYTLRVSPQSVGPGGTVTIDWTAPAGSSSRDWIGLYKEGEPSNTNFVRGFWFYTGGTTSGSRSFTMPVTSGRYEFRYLLNNGYTSTVQSGVVVVE
jgi:hypothetical protein